MLSTCLRGQSGPQSSYPGFGLQGACLSGLHRITGWPDRQPAGSWGAYTDFINPRFGSGVIAAAIRYRDLTGQGQHIDLAQTESAMHFSAPLLLDYFENGRVQLAPGHDSLYACPHGVFATEGVERYVAIATDTTEQWRALCAESRARCLDGRGVRRLRRTRRGQAGDRAGDRRVVRRAASRRGD